MGTDNRKKIKKCFHAVCDVALEAAILITCVFIAYVILIFFVGAVWSLFHSTQVGQASFEEFSYGHRMMSDFFDRHILKISLHAVIAAFIIGLVAGFILHFCYILRFIYYSRGIFGQITLCGLPLTFVVGLYIQGAFGYAQFDIPYSIGFVPTLAVFGHAFGVSGKYLPEAGDVIQFIRKRTRK